MGETDDELFEGLIPELDILFRQPESLSPGTAPETASDIDVLSARVDNPLLLYVPSPRGTYTMEEKELPEDAQLLLHGRAYVADREALTETSSGAPHVFYIAADRVNGLIVPARSISIENHGPGSAHYRWTDDGEKWTSWVTLQDGVNDNYVEEDNCRFAEVQVYVDTSGAAVSLRSTR